MTFRKNYGLLPLFIILLLFFASCGATAGDSAGGNGGLTLAARFSREDGTALDGNTVRLSSGSSGTDYPLDGNGDLQAAGLPRQGELLLALLDRQQEVQGTMTLSIGQGAVIDATTGEDGVGHITVRTDTDQVALLFDVKENGALTCTLWLEPAQASGENTERD